MTNLDQPFDEYLELDEGAREALIGHTPIDSEHLDQFHQIHKRLTEITFALLNQWIHKSKGYGLERYLPNELNLDPVISPIRCFLDTNRKFKRLYQLTLKASKGEEDALDALIETYADLANYAICNVYTIRRLKRSAQ